MWWFRVIGFSHLVASASLESSVFKQSVWRRLVEEDLCFLKTPTTPGHGVKLGNVVSGWPVTFQQQLHSIEGVFRGGWNPQTLGWGIADYATASAGSRHGKIYGEWGRELRTNLSWEDGEPFWGGDCGVGNEIVHWEAEVGGKHYFWSAELSKQLSTLDNSFPLVVDWSSFYVHGTW